MPVILNGDCTRQEMAAVFMKRLAGHFANETAIATPNGKILAHGPEEGLKKWKALGAEERKKLDNLGKYDLSKEPSPPKGGLVLKVFARPLVKDDNGVWQIYRHPKAHLSQEPGRDHAWLREDEWRSWLLAPQQALGDTAEVPEPIVDRLCRRYLIDLVRIGGEGGPRSKQNVLSQYLTMRSIPQGRKGVELFHLDGVAQYRTLGAEHGVKDKEGRTDTFGMMGQVEVNVRDKCINQFSMIALSETGHYDQIGQRSVALGILFELTDAESPAGRVRPHSYFDRYFGKD